MIGSRIKQFRIENGYSQSELAKLLDVTTRTIARWEQNKNKPNSSEYKKILELLGISEKELLDCKNEPTVPNSNTTPLTLLDKISDGVDNLVTGQETINNTFASSVAESNRRQDELISNLQSQNQELLRKLDEQYNAISSYRNEIDMKDFELHHRKIQTITVIVTCLIFLALLLGTWIFWMNNSYHVNDNVIEGEAAVETPSYFIIDEEE